MRSNTSDNGILIIEDDISEYVDITIKASKNDNTITLGNNDTHPLLGTWKVDFQEEGSVIYELKIENEDLIGYSIALFDVNGASIPDQTKVFKLKSFKNNLGKGLYFMEYEGENYEVPCQLKLEDGILYVSYDYYGYKNTERWELQ